MHLRKCGIIHSRPAFSFHLFRVSSKRVLVRAAALKSTPNLSRHLKHARTAAGAPHAKMPKQPLASAYCIGALRLPFSSR